MGHSSSKHAAPSHSPEELQAASDAEVALPAHFTVWYQKSWTKIICYLGDHAQSKPLYTIRLPAGWYGDLVLHGGPDVEYPAIARMKTTNFKMTNISVHFDGRMARPEEGGGPEELIRYGSRGKSEYYSFAVRVGKGSQRGEHVEKFEWRRSHGAEVKSLGLTRWGWKLVRLGSAGHADNLDVVNDTEAGEDSGDAWSGDDDEEKKGGTVTVEEKEMATGGSSSQRPEGFGYTTDGKEIVAVWADHKSLTKVGDLQFLNSGATGELGNRWAVMATLSNLLIWQRTMMQVTTAASVGA